MEVYWFVKMFSVGTSNGNGLISFVSVAFTARINIVLLFIIYLLVNHDL